MKNSIVLFLAAVMMVSCARMPYEQWSGRLNSMENELKDQESSAKDISTADILLFEGVYSVTKSGEAKPYPDLKKIDSAIKSSVQRISIETDSVVKHSENLKQMYFQQSIKTVGPEWDDFQTVFQELKDQKNTNTELVSELEMNDVVFDSLCNAHKIKAVPIGEAESALFNQKEVSEERFNSLNETYKGLKKEITKRENQKQSLGELNRMRLKIRQIEDEFFRLSNLLSRVESLRADVMIFEGPGVSPIEEIKMINQSSRKMTGFLDELETIIEGY